MLLKKNSNSIHFSSTASFYGSVESQLLVKDNNLKLQTISIDLFSNGENFLRLLQDKIGEKGSNYSIYFGSKKVF